MPGPPGWARWVWRGIMISVVALGLVGALEQTREPDQDEPDGERSGDRSSRTLD